MDTTTQREAWKRQALKMMTEAVSVSEIAAQTVNIFISGQGIPVNRLNKAEKIEIIRLLNQRGIFQLKGAVSDVARQLQCSEPSVYRYLSVANKSNLG